MRIVSVNVSTKKGTVKHSVPEIQIDRRGIMNDAHAGAWHRQVSMLSSEIVKEFETVAGRKINPGEFAENITVSGLDLRSVSVLDRFTSGDVELEVTQIGKDCHGNGCAVFREVGKCVMPKEGIFCRVLHGGTLKAGDKLLYRPKTLLIKIITLSDRASQGEYKDDSGSRITELIEEFFARRRWHQEIRAKILPDDATRLREELEVARKEGVDIVITTGGTGVGPRDITPDVVAEFIDKEIPGVMEYIRTKFGATNPNALLSRGIAGTMNKTPIYTLPGSVKAVEEYMSEILKTMEHLILTLHDLDIHGKMAL